MDEHAIAVLDQLRVGAFAKRQHELHWRLESPINLSITRKSTRLRQP